MLETLAKIVTSVRYQLQEPTDDANSFWSGAEIESYIQEGQETFSTETKCLSKFYKYVILAADISNEREIRLPSDFVALDEGGVLYNDEPLKQTSLAVLDEFGGKNWRDTTGTPTRFYKRSDYLGFYPKPTAGDTIKYYGIERATTLSAAVVPLSDDYRTVAFRRHIRNYAIAMCWYSKGEDSKGDRWMAKFNKGLYEANAILNGDKNQGMKLIPVRSATDDEYDIDYGDTSSFD